MGAVISVLSPKGGVGKTTTTLELAWNAAAEGDRVLVVDLDGQGNASDVLLGKDPRKDGVYDLLLNEDDAVTTASFLRKATANFPKTYVLAGDRRLGKIDTAFKDRVGIDSILKNCLEPVVGSFDWVFIDCPPALGSLTVNALVASNAYIAPMDNSSFSLDAIKQLEKLVEVIRKSLNKKLSSLGSLVVRVEKKNSKDFAEATAARKALTHIREISIPASTKVPQAHRAGASVSSMFPKENVSKTYGTLSKEIRKEIAK